MTNRILLSLVGGFAIVGIIFFIERFSEWIQTEAPSWVKTAIPIILAGVTFGLILFSASLVFTSSI